MRKTKSNRTAFTLVELLVVIGIIALLISILLPALAKAKKTANTVKCLANLRSISQAMLIYASQNKNYILGSPNTTGYPSFLAGTGGQGVSADNNGLFDWESPVLATIGTKIPYSPSADAGRTNGQARLDRMNFELTFPMFQCPENSILCPLYSGSTAFSGATAIPSVVPYMSYSTALDFLFVNSTNTGTVTNASGSQIPAVASNYNCSVYEDVPQSYAPKINKIGLASKKIFIADGARYIKPPSTIDMDFRAYTILGGNFADWGAQCSSANGRPRDFATGNTHVNGSDGRILWARHGGAAIPGGSGDTFRFNACFFDGHGETLGDLSGGNPTYWAPKGSTIKDVSSEYWPDVRRVFLGGQASGAYTIPE